MISIESARAKAIHVLETRLTPPGLEFVLVDNANPESAFAWVFFYDNKKHIESGDYRDALAGAGPILVDKLDGTVHTFGSAFAGAKCIAKYDELRRLGPTTKVDVELALKKEYHPGK